MALRRFFISPEQFTPPTIAISGDLFHHIKDVCRFSVGDEFELLPGDGTARRVRVESFNNRVLLVQEVAQRPLPAPAKPRLHLALSMPKFPKVDWIVEKSVELGVSSVYPFVSDFSFIRRTQDLSVAKLQRWQKLIQAATQQSGRGDLMTFEPIRTLPELLKDFNQKSGAAGLFPYEGESQKGLPAAVRELKQKGCDDLWIFVGSEGGFSREEVALFASQGLEPVSMGEQILRVETACVALVSVLKYEFGALGH